MYVMNFHRKGKLTVHIGQVYSFTRAIQQRFKFMPRKNYNLLCAIHKSLTIVTSEESQSLLIHRLILFYIEKCAKCYIDISFASLQERYEFSFNIVPIVKLRRLKLREMKSFAQGHTAQTKEPRSVRLQNPGT